MKKLLVLLALLCLGAAFAGAEEVTSLPLIDRQAIWAKRSQVAGFVTVTTNFVSTSAGQLLLGTTGSGTNQIRTVWMSAEAGSTNWTQIVPAP